MKDYEELEQYAIDLGYIVDKTNESQSGWKFKIVKNGIISVIWKRPLMWITADLVNQYHINHKQFKFDDFEFSDTDPHGFSNFNALKAALEFNIIKHQGE